MNYHVLKTPRFDRDAKKLVKRDRQIPTIILRSIEILSFDPLNLTRRYDIKKLKDVEEGSWRIRFGDYRLRYDIDDHSVVLTRIRHRKEVYEYKWISND